MKFFHPDDDITVAAEIILQEARAMRLEMQLTNTELNIMKLNNQLRKQRRKGASHAAY